MTKKSVFKVSACGHIFKVVTVLGIGDEPLWAVMDGRVYAARPFLYCTPDEAITRAVLLAKIELSKKDLLLFEP